MTRHKCRNCGMGLSGDEIALYKKMVFREAEEFLCLDCMAGHFSVARSRLEELIAYFHRTGICSLFVPHNVWQIGDGADF